MIVGHRWEYDYVWRGYRCVPLPLGGVESHQWCVGCGCRISDMEIRESGYPMNSDELSRNLKLDMLARGRGCEPIESGTYAEFKLRQKQGVSV